MLILFYLTYYQEDAFQKMLARREGIEIRSFKRSGPAGGNPEVSVACYAREDAQAIIVFFFEGSPVAGPIGEKA